MWVRSSKLDLMADTIVPAVENLNTLTNTYHECLPLKIQKGQFNCLGSLQAFQSLTNKKLFIPNICYLCKYVVTQQCQLT